MPTLALPADTVRFYNDGPDFPSTPQLMEAERAYRTAFAEAAGVVAEWEIPDCELIEAAWEERRAARDRAEVLVSSAELYGNPEYDSEQVLYRAGHDVEAARHRGRVQAFELAVQCWEKLENQGIATQAVGPLVMRPWAEQVREWALSPINTATIKPPPAPEESIDAGRRALLDRLVESVKPLVGNLPVPLAVKSVRQLINENPDLRRPVIHGLLREGETMNVIASPKVGKSWLVTDLALAVATGRTWLDTFECERGEVLLVDNELHCETSANRIPKVMKARGVALYDIADRVFVANVRGRLKDIYGLGEYFQQLPPGRFKLIALDAFYRFMPRDTDENDNGTMAQVYNVLDAFAARLGCAFALVHHSSKGNQSGKSVTDVGAGAGSQSRATDTHLILRPHEQDDVVVLDAAVRSWPPLSPRCLRWTFPVWTPDDSLDPADLRPERPRRRKEPKPAAPAATAWTGERFAAEFVGPDPQTKAAIIDAAIEAGLSERKAEGLLRRAELRGLVHRWPAADKRTCAYADVPPPIEPAPTEPTQPTEPSKRDAVLALLAAEPELSNRDVAQRCGVSHTFVRKLRGTQTD